MYHTRGILERRINIDRSQSNPRLSSIKGPKCQRTGPVHQKRLATPFPGDVLFLVNHTLSIMASVDRLPCPVMHSVQCIVFKIISSPDPR